MSVTGVWPCRLTTVILIRPSFFLAAAPSLGAKKLVRLECGVDNASVQVGVDNAVNQHMPLGVRTALARARAWWADGGHGLVRTLPHPARTYDVSPTHSHSLTHSLTHTVGFSFFCDGGAPDDDDEAEDDDAMAACSNGAAAASPSPLSPLLPVGCACVQSQGLWPRASCIHPPQMTERPMFDDDQMTTEATSP